MDVIFYSIYSHFPDSLRKRLKENFESLDISTDQLHVALKILTHVTANQYVYDFIDNPNTVNLKKKQTIIFNEIKQCISQDNFRKLSTIMHVLISEYNKIVIKNENLRKILIQRRNLISEASKQIKEEYLIKGIQKGDLDCWLEAEKTLTQRDIKVTDLIKNL